MPSAQTYAGITQGIANTQQYIRETPEREARLAEAQSRQKLSQLKLDEYQQQAPIRQEKADIELERLQSALSDERKSRLKNETFSAFDSYEGDGDTRHLNNFLTSAKANSAGSNIWNKWVRFDPMVRSQETEAMLGQAGITDIEGYFNDPELAKSKVLATDARGAHSLIDMNKLYQASGYLRHASARSIEALTKRASLDNLLKGVQTADTNFIGKILDENPGMKPLEAIKKYYAAKNTGKVSGSAIERTAAELRAKDPNLSFEQSMEQAAKISASPGGAEKNVEFTGEVRERVHKAAGGDFYSADLSDPNVRTKVGEQITALEQASKSEMTTEDRRLARKYRALTGLGESVGEELTAEQTGLIDSTLHSFKQYFTDNVEGVEATSAYATFRNFARNALMGATLTPAEIKSYNQAAGTLGQQLGPVLAKFKVQMQDIKARFQSIYDMNDPMIAQYYLGTDRDHIDSVIEGIDQRLEAISAKADTTIKATVPIANKGVVVDIKPDMPASPSGPTMTPAERWESFK